MSALQLRARAALRKGHGRWLLPPWIAPAFLLCAIVLLVWTGFVTPAAAAISSRRVAS